MRREESRRAFVRLRPPDSKARVRAEGLEALACLLADLSQGGCRCRLALAEHSPQTREALLGKFRPGSAVQVELSFDEVLRDSFLDAEVRSVEQTKEEALEAGLEFRGWPPAARQRLSRILLDIATQKVRRASTATIPAEPKGKASEAPAAPVAPPAPPLQAEAAAAAPLAQPAPPAGKQAPPTGVFAQTASKQARAVPPPPPTRAVAPVSESARIAVASQAARTVQRKPDPFFGKRLGDVLVAMGKLSRPEVEDAAAKASKTRTLLGRCLLNLGSITAEELCCALALQAGLPMTDRARVEARPELAARFPYGLLVMHMIVPVEERPDAICFVTGKPPNAVVLADLQRLAGKDIEIALAPEAQVLEELRRIKEWQSGVKTELVAARRETSVSLQLCDREGAPAGDAIVAGLLSWAGEGDLRIASPAIGATTPDELQRSGLCARVQINLGGRQAQALCQLQSILVRSPEQAGGLPWLIGMKMLSISPDDRRALRELAQGPKADAGAGQPPTAAAGA